MAGLSLFGVAGDNTHRHRLENDPMCGLVTGGREECWWDCHTEIREFTWRPWEEAEFVVHITNPSCLEDCYPPDHCLSSLLADYKAAGGVCQGSFLDVTFPGLYPVSDKPCELHEDDGYYYDYEVRTGLCSQQTEELLLDQENCIHPLVSQTFDIWQTTDDLIYSLCSADIYNDFVPQPLTQRSVKRQNKKKKKKEKIKKRNRNKHKLNPIEYVEVGRGF